MYNTIVVVVNVAITVTVAASYTRDIRKNNAKDKSRPSRPATITISCSIKNQEFAQTRFQICSESFSLIYKHILITSPKHFEEAYETSENQCTMDTSSADKLSKKYPGCSGNKTT